MIFSIEIEQEEDGRWIAEVVELLGVMVYGPTPDEAYAKVRVLALDVMAERLGYGDGSVFFSRIDRNGNFSGATNN